MHRGGLFRCWKCQEVISLMGEEVTGVKGDGDGYQWKLVISAAISIQFKRFEERLGTR